MRYTFGTRQTSRITQQLTSLGMLLVLVVASFVALPAMFSGRTFADTTLATPSNLHLINPYVPCGGYSNNFNLTATWDAVAGATSYEYSVTTPPGTPYEITPWTTIVDTNTFNGTFNMGQGPSTFSVQAIAADSTRSAWSTSCKVTYDSIAPAISDNFNVAMNVGDKVTLAPAVTDASPLTYQWGVSDDRLLANPHDPLSNETLVIGPAPKGAYTVTLTVTDAAGNATTVQYTVTISVPAGAAPLNRP